MNRKQFLASILGLIPAVHVVKEMLPKKEFIGGVIGEYKGVKIINTVSLTITENTLTIKDIEEMVKELEKYAIPKIIQHGKPTYPYFIHPKDNIALKKMGIRDIPFIESNKVPIINVWSS